jgi:hypothetical protein
MTDALLNLDTTVEDLSVIPSSKKGKERWNLTLRKLEPVRDV